VCGLPVNKTIRQAHLNAAKYSNRQQTWAHTSKQRLGRSFFAWAAENYFPSASRLPCFVVMRPALKATEMRLVPLGAS
jgi:hypothetical protein